MARIKLLVVALAIGLSGSYFLTLGARREVSRIETSATNRLADAAKALAPRLQLTLAAELGAAKQLAGAIDLAKSLDDAGKPTGRSLEVAVEGLSKLTDASVEKPDVLVLVGGGAAARYRVGASNRFDKDLSAVAALGQGGGARTLMGAIDGQLYQLALAPLATEDRSAPSPGTVALGFAMDDKLARRLGSEVGTGVDVTILSGHKILGSTLSPEGRKGLEVAARGGANGFEFGRLEGPRFALTELLPPSVKLPPLPLGAGELGANHGLDLPLGGGEVAMVLSSRRAGALAELADDQRLVLGGMAGLIALCLILAAFGANPAKGLPALAAAADKLAQGDLTARAPTEKVAPGVRRVAVALNAIAASAPARAAAPPRPQPNAGLDAIASPDALLRNAAATSVPAVPPMDTVAENLEETVPMKRAPAELRQPRAAGEDDFGGIFEPSAKSPPPSPTRAPPPPPAPMEDDGDSFSPDATVVAQVPEALVRATRPAPTAAPAPQRPSQASSGAIALPAPAANPEESHFQAVFREFVATRERCGEAADGLTFDRFASKLRKNKEQLVAKYACKSVRFQVYVKEGKAALKATPVRD